MRRRSFLSGALRLPAAVAALPILSALAPAAEQEGQAAWQAGIPEAPTILAGLQPMADAVPPAGEIFEEADVAIWDGQFWLTHGPNGNSMTPLTRAVRDVLVRGADGVVRVWSLDHP